MNAKKLKIGDHVRVKDSALKWFGPNADCMKNKNGIVEKIHGKKIYVRFFYHDGSPAVGCPTMYNETIFEKIKNRLEFDPKERSIEKQKSRDEDQRSLDSGEKSQEDLRRENSMFSGLDFSKVKIKFGDLY